MELKAGLGGHAVTDHATEIRIRLFSASTVLVELEVSDRNGLTILPIQLEEQIPETIWLPVTPRRNSPVNVRLRAGEDLQIEEELTFRQSRTSLTLISSSIPAHEAFSQHQPSGGISPVILSASSLPHTTQAYAGIGAIVTDQQSLSGLTQDQYDALGNFLGRCGIMLISGADNTLLERLRRSSGCSGKFIRSFDTLSQLTPRLLELNAARPPKPPAADDLLSLLETVPQHKVDVILPLYLGGYILLMTFLTWRMKNSVYLLILPVFIAGAGILVWSGAGSHQLITWVETESDDNHARVTRLLLLGGDRRGQSWFILGPETNLLDFGDDTQHSSIRYQAEGSRRVLHVNAHLLSPRTYHLTSITRHSPQFRLSVRDGYPEVVFLGNMPFGEIHLIWRGKSFNVPMMSLYDRWQPNEVLGQSPVSAAERLLNKRLPFDDPALLLRYSTDPVKDIGSALSWLVIRHDRGQVL